MKIALAGNPNSGKTTLFNALTGSKERVGNWTGVTVAKAEALLKKNILSTGEDIVIVDLPGAYSMSPFTSEENITSDFVKNENPDVIINIVDATNLSRNLFFTTQLLELGIPVVIALNKSDINVKKDTKINNTLLSEELGCKVVSITASAGDGLPELMQIATSAVGAEQKVVFEHAATDVHNESQVVELDKKRFAFVDKIVSKVEDRKLIAAKRTKQDKVDKVLANKWIGIPIFAVVMWLVFTLSQTYIGPFFGDGVFSLPAFEETDPATVPLILHGVNGWIGTFGEWANGAMEAAGASPILIELVGNGIIGGVGAVVGFLPLIMVMFFLLALLEDCGYMARVAVVMDRFFKLVGLSGRSIIPMVIGTSCAIPGVMATRTIKNERQRRSTAMLAPFMPCGAKIPIIALFAGMFFAGEGWVSALTYFVGIALIIIGAFIVVRITGEKNARQFFIIELPEYKAPSFIKAALSMLSRAKAFIIKAGTIILLCNLIVQVAQAFTWNFTVAEDPNTSILAGIAGPVAVLLIPLGFGTWQLASAAVTGFIAKENVVGTLAVVFSLDALAETGLVAAGDEMQVAGVMGLTAVSAMAYLMFNLYTPPCFAAIGAMNAEMESKKWLWGGIAFQFATGFTVAFFVYQIGTLVTTGAFGHAFIQGLIAVAVMIGIVVALMIRGGKKAKLREMA